MSTYVFKGALKCEIPTIFTEFVSLGGFLMVIIFQLLMAET